MSEKMNEKSTFAFGRAIDRRSFVKYCAALGAGVVAGGALQSVFDVMRIGSRLFKVSDTRLRMGTYVTITALHESRSLAEDALGGAFEEMDRLIGILSRHDGATPLSVLNAGGAISAPPPELTAVVTRSLEFHAQTRGAFDVTVGPLVDLFRSLGQAGRAPTDDEINQVLTRVGSDKIEVGEGTIRLGSPGMSLTLDGIAKGYVVDRVSDVLAARGIDNHLVNAGGDIRARGYRSEDRPWTVAIEDPEKRGRYRDVVRLTSGAVATSGDYEIYYDEERLFHHVVDPHTGRSPTHTTSVSVVAESVMRADALSTAVFVMEPAAGTRLVDSLPSSECLLIDHAGARKSSRNWSAHTARQSA